MSQLNFPTVSYMNKLVGGAMHLPAEDFENGKCTLLVRQLLKQFRSEPDDAKATELREAALREAEKYENMVGVAADEDSLQKSQMRHAYALDCINQMNL